MGRIALENLVKNWPRELIFIGFSKYSRWGPEQVKIDISVDRPVDQPTVRFLTVRVTGRPPGRPP